MVLFLFVIMMLNLGPKSTEQESRLFSPGIWIGPSVLAVVLLGELIFILSQGASGGAGVRTVTPKQVGTALFGPYVIGVELASMLLLAGLVGAYHLGHRKNTEEEEGKKT